MLFFDIGGGLPAGMETEAILGSLLMHSIHEALRRMSKMPKEYVGMAPPEHMVRACVWAPCNRTAAPALFHWHAGAALRVHFLGTKLLVRRMWKTN
jgi:hypothetical protein